MDRLGVIDRGGASMYCLAVQVKGGQLFVGPIHEMVEDNDKWKCPGDEQALVGGTGFYFIGETTRSSKGLSVLDDGEGILFASESVEELEAYSLGVTAGSMLERGIEGAGAGGKLGRGLHRFSMDDVD